MKKLILSALVALNCAAHAADDEMEVTTSPAPASVGKAKTLPKPAKTMRFTYKSADINRVIEDYAKASGQKFIVDGQVKGKISIFNPGPVSIEEAFNQLSTALAANGTAISIRDDQMYVSAARMIQRDLIPVVTEVPPVRPDRMVTLVINLKHVSAEEVNKQLRIMNSRDGESVAYTPNNQLLISDWTPNLRRIAEIVKQIDVPAENPGQPSTAPAALVEPSDEPAEVPTLPRLKPAAKPKAQKPAR